MWIDSTVVFHRLIDYVINPSCKPNLFSVRFSYFEKESRQGTENMSVHWINQFLGEENKYRRNASVYYSWITSAQPFVEKKKKKKTKENKREIETRLFFFNHRIHWQKSIA